MGVDPDFSGYATKAGRRCSDGRVIKASAFKHMDGMTVPLVWQHGHKDPENVLGHALLEVVADGVRAHGTFNNTPKGQHVKQSIIHGDLKALSIYANNLRETPNKLVEHGNIREVSVVLSGANPEATIDYVRIQHSEDPEDVEILDDEAIIHSGEKYVDFVFYVEDDSLAHEEDEDEMPETDVQHADAPAADATVKDIYDSMSDAQKDVVHYMIGVALEEGGSAAQSESDEGALAHQEGTDTVSNLFERTAENGGEMNHTGLPEADVKSIFANAVKFGSLKHSFQNYFDTHAELKHGIESIDILFPDAKNITGAPELEKRRTEWVSKVLAETRKTPFSRIKTFSGDLTQDEARAKGYIKGNFKKEEWFGVTKRTTTPTTIYKKQKLDRDDILDITDMDVVAWLKAEMRLMTEEEFARAILIGDGRDISDEDKVKDPAGASDGAGLRSILNDHELFVTTLNVNVSDANSNYEEVVDAVLDGMEYYKGTGTPTLFTTVRHLNMFLKAKDGMGRRYYANKAEVAQALGVKEVVTVEVMQNQTPDVIGIIVNLDDYNVGTDRGGELTMFDDFDIDYNQYKYLLETRASGALVRPKSALVVKKTAAASVQIEPTKPAFNATTGVITIPTQTGTVYKDSEGNTITAGAMTALAAGQAKTIYAQATSGYHYPNTISDSWMFKRPSA